MVFSVLVAVCSMREAQRNCAASSTAGGHLLCAGVGLTLHRWCVLNNLPVPFTKGQKNPKGLEGKGTLKEFVLWNLICWERKMHFLCIILCFAVGNLERNKVIVWGEKKKKHNKKNHKNHKYFY